MRNTLAPEVEEISAALGASESSAPPHYSTLSEEYRAVREGAAVRDASHRGRLRLSGEDHLDFLHRMTTNHCLELLPGTTVEVVFPDNRGRIITYASCHHLRGGTTLVVSETRGTTELTSWLERYHFAERMEIASEDDSTAMIELIGPDSSRVAATVGIPIAAASDGGQLPGEFGGNVVLIRHDQFANLGLRVAGPARALGTLWRQLRAAGCQPVGEEAFDTVRIEAGKPGDRELTLDFNPWEAGLSRAVHMNKGCYIGQEIIARLDTYDKVKQHLVGLSINGDEIPEPGTCLNAGNRGVGKVTSAAFSPRLNGVVALAYLRNAHCKTGTEVAVDDGRIATVRDLPFTEVTDPKGSG